jgi:hypothetical protein
MTVSTQEVGLFSLRIKPLLSQIYGKETAEELADRLYSSLGNYLTTSGAENLDKWSEDNIISIAYGDSICNNNGEPPLVTLERFLSENLQDTITGAFHPNATQFTLHPMNQALFAFWRQSRERDQSIFCIHNLSDRTQKLDLSTINLICTDPWCDLLSGLLIEDIYSNLILKPYQSVWITNKF